MNTPDPVLWYRGKDVVSFIIDDPIKPIDYSEIPVNTFPFFREINIVGQHFLDDLGKDQLKYVAPGSELVLRAEPENKADPYAVAAYSNGIRVGYVQKQVSPAVAWLLAIQMPLKVTVVTAGGKAGNLTVNVLEGAKS